MPRTKKTDKFFRQGPKKYGDWKNWILIGPNPDYPDKITLQDLVDYLKENEIDLKSIEVKSPFISKK